MTPAELAACLESRQEECSHFSVVTGFDGFVDEMIDVVGERTSLSEYGKVQTISDFGSLVQAAAGQSSLREIVIRKADPGGCAVNMADGLATMGVSVHTFATVGEPVHPAFATVSPKVRLTSWGDEPGRTLAFEFNDGKLMFSSVKPLAEFTPQHVKRLLADGIFQQACENAKLIAFTDWTLYPHMTACWNVLRTEVLEHLSCPPHVFFDLVDPSSRTRQDICDMLDELAAFSCECRVTLGVNQNEANILCDCLSLPCAPAIDSLKQAATLRERLGLHEVVIHAQASAVSSTLKGTSSEEHQVDGFFCPSPLKSTGAGDRFNAGYALGILLQLEAADRLLLGNASSGLYVRHGESPSLEQLIPFLKTWKGTDSQP